MSENEFLRRFFSTFLGIVLGATVGVGVMATIVGFTPEEVPLGDKGLNRFFARVFIMTAMNVGGVVGGVIG